MGSPGGRSLRVVEFVRRPVVADPATVEHVRVVGDGQAPVGVLLDEYAKLLSSKTKLVAVTQVCNALGTVTPAEQFVGLGHRAGARVLIDGAQSVPHLRCPASEFRSLCGRL